ncbi:MAG: RNA polymerase sigma factor [Oscillospiraceae bacterium]|nr:RNA polymerase sigma factor [Oscillospiraceae bacterium]
MSDGEIVKLYLARDESASALCIEKYHTRLLRLASAFLADSRDAEECVNDTFLKAWNAIPPHQPPDLFPFLARLCRCTAYDIIKKSKTAKRSAQIVELTSEMEECIPDAVLDAEASDETLAALINRFLAALSRDSRMIFVRHYWFGEAVSEIAARFDFSESKVKTSLHRTREKLKKFLLKEGVSL